MCFLDHPGFKFDRAAAKVKLCPFGSGHQPVKDIQKRRTRQNSYNIPSQCPRRPRCHWQQVASLRFSSVFARHRAGAYPASPDLLQLAMTTQQHQHRQQLSHLTILPPSSTFKVQQQNPLFSPRLPTTTYHDFSSESRPVHLAHRADPSVAVALAAAGILSPPGMPMILLGQEPFTQLIRLLKAQLGSADKNYCPIHKIARKCNVSFPKKTAPGAEGPPPTRATVVHTPVPQHLIPSQQDIHPPETVTDHVFPEDHSRFDLPEIERILPGRSAWDEAKKKLIDEKVEKLGVEKGTNSHSNIPYIHAPPRPGAALGADAFREPDARSGPGPGAPTDQSLAPPAMSAPAGGRPGFVRGFGLDVPKEADEDEEDEQADGRQEVEEAAAAAAEEAHVLAEASHVAMIDIDDMLDMELDADADADADADTDADVADAKVDGITAVANMDGTGYDVTHTRYQTQVTIGLPLTPLTPGATRELVPYIAWSASSYRIH
ncbi:hypothetical protein BC834DRAFT_1045661 [Gloeopeniophorella convolvens]|nr:hypothetical protein BC834DRAFT_1045661 [Gloeopeniophorella convolvens]